jgi:hypothetical protein
MPTVRNNRVACGKSHLIAKSPTKAPIENDPVTLMMSVPHGKSVPKSFPDPMPTR